ncbi:MULTISPECIES: HAD family hydrolase [unclassified Roseofilum]|uniref:HAD family hydrolase n=1 Tax=unclassified Roseofilum TaxID=2620099 RepID=UPI000E9E3911|nr:MULTISPECIES: HAD family hydrolase [unclassified Roseofilum]HBR00688.1 HAD family hydrolase [Cyanobacteria bacterium UBA11691]MBP0008712.1 HAD family hydrolase [Roseofilum sp. Belize Diploria]MBP0014599.1 HAD family hydrolase [Roseofilum sp. SID3]MBP0026048.1 HAD family hydrolase [Roseofilum sp. SID2]MBP0033981.1 HAD family hydrolase [Roseofilum sp. Belize BBD 4]
MVTVVCHDRQFENISAILFDKDGTLAHSEPYLRHLAQRRARLIDAQIPGVGEPLLMAFGVDEQGFNPAGLTAVGSRQENKIAAAAYVAETGRCWLESLEIINQAFQEADRVMQNKAKETVVLPGVAEVFDRLRRSHLKLGVVSSDIRENIEKFLDFYQLSDYIQIIQGAEPHLTKPNPQVFWSACEQLGVSPQEVLMVGDAPGDFTMARNAQAAGSIGVAWGWSRRPNLDKADVAIAKLDEIQAIG